MLAVTGILIIAATVLLFTLAVLTARRPDPPVWISNEFSMDVIAIAFTGGVATGAAILLRYLSEFGSGLLAAAEAGMILVIVASFIVIWRMLRVRETLAKYDAAMPAPASVGLRPFPAAKSEDGGPDEPTRPRTTPGAGGVSRKRAA